jgi:DnaA family protein
MNRPAAYLPLGERGQDPNLLDGCEALSLICLDDIEAVVGDAAWERAVFRLYTELEDRSGRLLIAARTPPTQSPIQLRDLASRLGGGAVLRLEQLSDEEQIEALQLRALRLGLELPQDAAHYLMRHLPRDMHSQCDALNLLDDASLATQRRLTVPFVRETLEHRKRER